MIRETVEMDTDTFDPVRKMVPPDTEIVWKNVGFPSHVIDSVLFHDVADDWQFWTQTLRPGDSAVYQFNSTGIYEYYWGLEEWEMCGVILIADVSITDPLSCEDLGEG